MFRVQSLRFGKGSQRGPPESETSFWGALLWKGTTYVVTLGGKDSSSHTTIRISIAPWKTETSKEQPSLLWGHLSDPRASRTLERESSIPPTQREHQCCKVRKTWQPGNKIPNARNGILIIPGTTLSIRNSITSTKSTKLSLGLSQASTFNHIHWSTAHSPHSPFAWVCSTEGWWIHSNPGEGFCDEQKERKGKKGRARKTRKKTGREGGREWWNCA